jgi:hypothetical protein
MPKEMLEDTEQLLSGYIWTSQPLQSLIVMQLQAHVAQYADRHSLTFIKLL